VSKQSGTMFVKWIQKQFPVMQLSDFERTNRASILAGSDKSRKQYANSKLNSELEEKGIDLLLKKDDKFILGQVKFITAEGGGQDNQFYEALRFVSSTKGTGIRIAILDGIIWFNKKYLDRIKASGKNIICAMLLKDFVDAL